MQIFDNKYDIIATRFWWKFLMIFQPASRRSLAGLKPKNLRNASPASIQCLIFSLFRFREKSFS